MGGFFIFHIKICRGRVGNLEVPPPTISLCGLNVSDVARSRLKVCNELKVAKSTYKHTCTKLEIGVSARANHSYANALHLSCKS